MSGRQKILITGGAGQIGTLIARDLMADHEVKALDIQEPKGREVEFIRADLRDLAGLKEVTRGIDCIIHLAAYSRERSIPSYPEGWEVNCTSTFNVFEAAAMNGVQKVIFASSICATGVLTWACANHSIEYFPIDENHLCRPQDLYGTSKLIGENVAWMYSKRCETRFIGLRMATVWFQKEQGIDSTTEWIINTYVKDPAAWAGIPSTEKRRFALKDLPWQYVDARDVVQAFRLSFENNDIKYGIFNIGAEDTPSSWESLQLARYFYPEVPIRNPLIYLVDRKKALWDISKARKELGFRPVHSWSKYFA